MSVSHQLLSRMSATVGYYHRNSHNISTTDRTNVSLADYVPFTVPMPALTSPNLAGGTDATPNGILDSGELLTIYKISSAAAAVYGTGLVDRNVPDQSIYNGVDVSLQARLKGGSTVVGSWSTEKNVSVFCSNQNNPNGPTIPDLYSATLAANGGRFCDQRKFHIPFQNEFKASAAIRSLTGGSRRAWCCRATRARRASSPTRCRRPSSRAGRRTRRPSS